MQNRREAAAAKQTNHRHDHSWSMAIAGVARLIFTFGSAKRPAAAAVAGAEMHHRLFPA
jgi:hypothetical protein